MQLHQLDKRIGRILSELRTLAVREVYEVDGIESRRLPDGQYARFENGGHWGGECEWWDFRLSVQIPENFSGRVVLSARTGRESGWDAVNPQFLAWVNGRVEQALDTRHTQIELAGAAPGAKYEILLNGYAPPLIENYSFVDSEPPRLYLMLEDRREYVEQLIYDITCPFEAACLLGEGERDRELTLEILARAIDLLDLRDPNGEDFERSVLAAREYLGRELYGAHRDLPTIATAQSVGHTHIDVAWLWDIEQTRHKAARSFATVLKLMDKYPEYKFMSSQAALYKFVKEDQPELYERIRGAVADGRWEVEGGMWVEADCNLASGESLVRQFLYGQRLFEREFGKLSRILWLPDVFGYSAALPQIMKKSGIDYFMTTKISWSEFNRIPYDTFMWRGLDGTKVLTHFSPSRDFDEAQTSSFTTYNAMMQPSMIAGGWKRYQQKALDDHFLVAYGYGDGGGGPTDWMLENARRMDVPLPVTPRVEQSFAREFFEGLESRVGNDPRLPVWTGELYLEFHRGTYTAVAKNKRNNRKIELMLREVELWCEYAARQVGHSYPGAELVSTWEDILTLQFHDILPGSSIKKVYDDSDETYARAFARLHEYKSGALAALAELSDGDLVVFNPMSHGRGDIVWFDAPDEVTALRDSDGALYPVQRYGNRAAAYVGNLAPMTGTPLWYDYEPMDDEPLSVSTKAFDTPYLSGEFDDNMRISSLIEKGSGRQVARAGEPLNRIVCYENKPHRNDAWEMNIYYDRRKWEVDDVKSAEVVSRGPVFAIVRVIYSYRESEIIQDVVIYNNICRVDFETVADWREKQYLLKAHFPVDVFYDEATYDIQYGNVRRPTHKNTSWDVAKFEVCAHKWADVSEHDFGVSLINDCKYGYSIDEGGMALTLLKSSTAPDPDADQCTHIFTYSIMPHVFGWREGGTADMGYRLNMPLTCLKAGGGDRALLPMCELNDDGIYIESVKAAEDEDATIIRVYECFGRQVRGALITLAHPAGTVYECDMLERRLAPADHDDYQIEFDIKPYEIKTFLVER